MENLIEAIRAALQEDSEPIARQAGLVACRKILAVLEAATAGEPAAPASPAAMNAQPEAPSVTATTSAPAAVPSAPAVAPTAAQSPAPRIDPAMVATLVASLGKLPPEQLLDLAITRLRAALPPGTTVPAQAPLRFQLIPLQHLERPK